MVIIVWNLFLWGESFPMYMYWHWIISFVTLRHSLKMCHLLTTHRSLLNIPIYVKKNIYIIVLKWVFLSTHYHPLFCFKPAFFSWPLFHRYIKNQKVSVYQSFPLTLLIILELSHLYSKHAFITFNKYLTRLGIKNHILSQIMRDFFSHVLPELLFNLNLFCKTCDCEPHNISTARRQQPYSWEKNPWKLNKTTLFWSTSLSINGKK